MNTYLHLWDAMKDMKVCPATKPHITIKRQLYVTCGILLIVHLPALLQMYSINYSCLKKQRRDLGNNIRFNDALQGHKKARPSLTNQKPVDKDN